MLFFFYIDYDTILSILSLWPELLITDFMPLVSLFLLKVTLSILIWNKLHLSQHEKLILVFYSCKEVQFVINILCIMYKVSLI